MKFLSLRRRLQRARLEGAVRQKCRRLGLEVVVNRPGKTITTTSTLLSSGIVTHKQVLQVLAGAMKKAAEAFRCKEEA